MKKKTIIGVIVVVVFCILVAAGFFLLDLNEPADKSNPNLPWQMSNIKRKLAWTSDPVRNLRDAEAAEAQGNWKKALFHYNYLAKVLPMENQLKGYASYKEALCNYNLGDYSAARQKLEWALNNFQDMPQVEKALFLMAQIYTKLGDFELAYKTYNNIIRMFPSVAQEAREKQQQLPYHPGEQKQDQKTAPKKLPN